ncbi:hypothetical protein WJX84_010220 [Apatococcus fuscideae]|uniref:Uncharacterized protein n=1 Tax=Apatococcus fuscideae TaxID=2026836 RepID=A0AAW1T2K7_9CHLO
MLGGAQGTTVGALRTLHFASLHSQGQFMEQLAALDDVEHYMRWHAVPSEANVNPFPGAYLNAGNFLRLKPVTTGCQTLLEVEVKFLTEPSHAEIMQRTLSRQLDAAMAALRDERRAARSSELPFYIAHGLAEWWAAGRKRHEHP